MRLEGLPTIELLKVFSKTHSYLSVNKEDRPVAKFSWGVAFYPANDFTWPPGNLH